MADALFIDPLGLSDMTSSLRGLLGRIELNPPSVWRQGEAIAGEGMPGIDQALTTLRTFERRTGQNVDFLRLLMETAVAQAKRADLWR